MTIVSKRYAQALMNLAVRENLVEQAGGGLDAFADAVADSTRLQAFLSEPRVPQAAKEAAVVDLLDKIEVPAVLGNFLRLITQKRRIDQLEDIRSDFHELADERMGRAHADVTVASPLGADQEDRLRNKLESLSGKQINLRMHIDPTVIGGMVARIGSTVWDGSLRNQLNRIHQSILEG